MGKSLTKILTTSLALFVLTNPLYASSKKQDKFNYDKFINKYDRNGDGAVWLVEYLQNFLDKNGNICREKFIKEMNYFYEHDLYKDCVIDEKDKELNEGKKK